MELGPMPLEGRRQITVSRRLFIVLLYFKHTNCNPLSTGSEINNSFFIE